MNKFLILNPELRELVGDEKTRLIERKINQFKVSVNLIFDETQRVIFQPDGQSLVLSVCDESDRIDCESCQVPLNVEIAEMLVGRVDNSEWPYIFPGQKMEDFPGYRIDYFVQNGKSTKDQVRRHNELTEAGLVDAVVQVHLRDVDNATLVEIFAGKRFSQEH